MIENGTSLKYRAGSGGGQGPPPVQGFYYLTRDRARARRMRAIPGKWCLDRCSNGAGKCYVAVFRKMQPFVDM